jgi:glycosyltransferase involved in cell wall biosynthesis
LGKGTFPTIGWIADFQHKHLPEFFSQTELAFRDKNFKNTFEESTCVILSSNAAKADAQTFYPEYAEKFRVLHFGTGTIDFSSLPDISLMKEKYQINGPYFLVPNQFWIHKNHKVILEAMNYLKKQGRSVTVIATGNISDHRQPGYFAELMKKMQDYDISNDFIVTGIVPYNDLLVLMLHAIAVINPSLFEGWSTSVEEAKALNLNIILSNIPVHLEQNPEKGVFFLPDNPEQLAGIMLDFLHREQVKNTEIQFNKINERIKERQQTFALDYENIVFDTIGKSP